MCGSQCVMQVQSERESIMENDLVLVRDEQFSAQILQRFFHSQQRSLFQRDILISESFEAAKPRVDKKQIMIDGCVVFSSTFCQSYPNFYLTSLLFRTEVALHNYFLSFKHSTTTVLWRLSQIVKACRLCKAFLWKETQISRKFNFEKDFLIPEFREKWYKSLFFKPKSFFQTVHRDIICRPNRQYPETVCKGSRTSCDPHHQCDQIGRFIALWATFQSLQEQIFCLNCPQF